MNGLISVLPNPRSVVRLDGGLEKAAHCVGRLWRLHQWIESTGQPTWQIIESWALLEDAIVYMNN